ncbi:MAG: hypothetical protein QW506_00560 [Thermoproteota archaeon]
MVFKTWEKRRVGKGTIILLLLVVMRTALNIVTFNLQDINGKYENSARYGKTPRQIDMALMKYGQKLKPKASR